VGNWENAMKWRRGVVTVRLSRLVSCSDMHPASLFSDFPSAKASPLPQFLSGGGSESEEANVVDHARRMGR